jgi:hypothetical protein
MNHLYLPNTLEIEPCTSPAGNIALTAGIPSSTEEKGLLFTFIADTKPKRAKKI